MAANTPGRSVGNASSLPLRDGSHVAAPGGRSPHQNHLLDALPASDYERLSSRLELIPMALGEVLCWRRGAVRVGVEEAELVVSR